MQRIKPVYIVVGVVAVFFVVLVVSSLGSDRSGTTTFGENVVARTLGAVETNAGAVFTVGLVEGSDPEHESEHMFEALASLPGVGEASLRTDTLELTVTYSDSLIDEQAIAERLMDAGYIAPTRADATPTELAADGSVQRIAIDDDGMRFRPYLILVKAGVPIEFEFAPGQECRITVKFPQVGVEQDISQGGVVSLPALEPGTYDIVCSSDGIEGRIFAE